MKKIKLILTSILLCFIALGFICVQTPSNMVFAGNMTVMATEGGTLSNIEADNQTEFSITCYGPNQFTINGNNIKTVASAARDNVTAIPNSGYVFVGFSSNTQGQEILSNGMYSINTYPTVYAIFKKLEVKINIASAIYSHGEIKLSTAGGTGSFSSTGNNIQLNDSWQFIENIGSNPTLIASATSQNYALKGWYYTNKDMSNANIKEFNLLSRSKTYNLDLSVFTSNDIYIYAVYRTNLLNFTVEKEYDFMYMLNYPTGDNGEYLLDCYYYYLSTEYVVPSTGAPYKEERWAYEIYNKQVSLKGFNFLGWSTTTSADDIITPNNDYLYHYGYYSNGFNPTKQDQNKKIYAIWQEETYTIHFDANGGSGIMQDQTVNYTQNIKLNKNAFTNTGYTFMGWSTIPNGQVEFADEQSVSQLNNSSEIITLYAVWQINTYSVTILSNNTNIGTVSKNTINVPYNSVVNIINNTLTINNQTITADIVNNPGYITNFVQWTGVSNGQTITSSLSITAEFNQQPISYTIKYNGNSGVGEVSNQILQYNQTQNFKSNAFEKTGHTFKGWATEPTGEVVYMPGEQFNNLTINNNEIINLYAVWQVNQFTVKYNPNGADGSMLNQPMFYGLQYLLTSNSFTKDGYNFLGWAKTADGFVEFNDCEQVSNLSLNNNDVITLYAVWQKITYSISSPNSQIEFDCSSYSPLAEIQAIEIYFNISGQTQLTSIDILGYVGEKPYIIENFLFIPANTTGNLIITATLKGFQVELNDNKYMLTEAINLINNSTNNTFEIEIIVDEIILNQSIVIAKDKTVYISAKNNVDIINNSNTNMFYINKNSKLIMQDNISIINTTQNNTFTVYGSLEIKSIEITSQNIAVEVCKDGQFIVENSTFNTCKSAVSIKDNSTAELKNCTIKNSQNAITNYGQLSISGVDFINNNSDIVSNKNVEIKDIICDINIYLANNSQLIIKQSNGQTNKLKFTLSNYNYNFLMFDCDFNNNKLLLELSNPNASIMQQQNKVYSVIETALQKNSNTDLILIIVVSVLVLCVAVGTTLIIFKIKDKKANKNNK